MMKEMQFFSRFEAVEQKTVLCAICQAANAVNEPIIKFSKITYKMPKKKIQYYQATTTLLIHKQNCTRK